MMLKLLLLIFYLAQVSWSCQSDSTMLIMKRIGDNVELRCTAGYADCSGTTYEFYHTNPVTGQSALVHEGSHRYIFIINDLDDAGEYRCAKKCIEGTTRINDCGCHWKIVVPPMALQWNISKIMKLNGTADGSCMATGFPRPLLKVIIQSQGYCDYRTKSIMINNYTTKVEFELSRITRDCQAIYCFAVNHPQSPLEKKTLNITIENSTAFNFTDVELQNINDTIIPVHNNNNQPFDTTGGNNKVEETNNSGPCNNSNPSCKNAAKRDTVQKFVLYVTLVLAIHWIYNT